MTHVFLFLDNIFDTFQNARLVLDDFEVVMHSSDSIAPVGVLHPLAFHTEHKPKYIEGACDENIESVFDVPGDCLQIRKEKYPLSDVGIDLAAVKEVEIHTSMTRKDDTFSLSCWLRETGKTSAGKGLMLI